jgi:hypothetical protein
MSLLKIYETDKKRIRPALEYYLSSAIRAQKKGIK